MKFSYHLPINLLFGSGEIAKTGEQTALWGKRALVVTGQSCARTGLLERVLGYLRASGVSAVVFDKTKPNPLTTTAEEGAEFAKNEECDVVVGIGGGSILDAAKGIAFLVGIGGDLNEYIFGKQPKGEALPLILAPTTCGTGSECNSFAVFTNPETKDKKSLRTVKVIAKASIVDPELMKTMPQKTIASVGLDAFCHNMEAYLSKNAQPLTDYMALEGMKIITDSLPKLCGGGGNMSDWEEISWASALGGMVINTAGVAAPHAMEHPISGLTDAVHGQGLAAITPSILEFTVVKNTEGREKDISLLLGGKSAMDFPDVFRRFTEKLGINCTLSDLGVTDNDLDWLTENCLKVSASGLAAHPAAFTAAQIRQIYKAAL